MTAEIKLGAAIISDGYTQEDTDRICALVRSMAEVLINLDVETRFHVMGSLLSSYGFCFGEPANAIAFLANDVLQCIPEATEQMKRKPQ